jgi:hypothetical protein
LGASHQTGWTGVIAKTIQLFGMLDGNTLLEAGKKAVFVPKADIEKKQNETGKLSVAMPD